MQLSSIDSLRYSTQRRMSPAAAEREPAYEEGP